MTAARYSAFLLIALSASAARAGLHYSGEEIAPLPSQWRGYLIDHMPLTFLLDREGQYVAFFPPGTPAERMAVMVRESMGGKP